MMKALKTLLLLDSPVSLPRGYDFKDELEDANWNTEKDIYNALKEIGCEVSIIAICNDINILLDEVKNNKPDIIFNLADVFNGKPLYDKNIASVLEMLGIPFTGAFADSLLLCNNKALSKKILSFHRIKVPSFHTFYKKNKIQIPEKMKMPAIVKPLCEEASRGIAQASIVDNNQALSDRITFIHSNMDLDAIAEEYIEGRELYASVFGAKRIKVFPLRELNFGQFCEDEPRIATYKAKWDEGYRKKWGIKNIFADNIPDYLVEKIESICKKAFKYLNMRHYGRFDIRLTKDEKVYIIEANANPCLAKDDEVALSAIKHGIEYNTFIKKIMDLALKNN